MTDARQQKKRERAARRKRAKMIEKYKPACPDCLKQFDADDHVNRCAFCGYYLCDACAQSGNHASKCRPNLGRITGGKL